MDHERRRELLLKDLLEEYVACCTVCESIAKHYPSGFVFLKYLDFDELLTLTKNQFKNLNIIYPTNRLLYKHPYEALWVKDSDLYLVGDFSLVYVKDRFVLYTLPVWFVFLKKIIGLFTKSKNINHLRY